MGFLKVLAKETKSEFSLEEQEWNDLISLLKDLLASPEVQLSSNAVSILTAAHQQHPEIMQEYALTTEELQAYRLGKLMSTKSQQDQINLVDFIFTVILNNDKVIHAEVDALRSEKQFEDHENNEDNAIE